LALSRLTEPFPGELAEQRVTLIDGVPSKAEQATIVDESPMSAMAAWGGADMQFRARVAKFKNTSFP
jgi:hypothetical protein